MEHILKFDREQARRNLRSQLSGFEHRGFSLVAAFFCGHSLADQSTRRRTNRLKGVRRATPSARGLSEPENRECEVCDQSKCDDVPCLQNFRDVSA
jgi:hypothetical protein